MSPGFFDALRVPLIAGRTFTEQDTPDRPPVVIIGQSMARQFWPNQDPVGQIVDSDQKYTIIGVVGDASFFSIGVTPPPQVYLSYRNTSEPNRSRRGLWP